MSLVLWRLRCRLVPQALSRRGANTATKTEERLCAICAYTLTCR